MSCGKNEFSLNFNLAEDVTDNFNVTYYANDLKGGLTIQAVASVREGKCELEGVTREPTLIYITARRSKFPLVVYVKRGNKIEITGEGKDPLAWEIREGDINDELTEWRQTNLEILKANDSDSVNNVVREFVESHNEDPVATILMLTYYNRKDDQRGYADLMASLRGKAREESWLRLMGRSDQLYHSYSYPARLESMVMRSVKDGADTLSADGKNPLFLLFWQTGGSERKIIVDSIKVLKKEIPDSSILIADVCLDVDSSSWRSAIRRDSLDDIKRFWVPTSLADPTVMKLKVTGIPYYIVFDSDGYQSYRGNDLEAAMKDYRGLVNRKDS